MTQVTPKDLKKLKFDRELEKFGKCMIMIPIFPRTAGLGEAPGFVLVAADVPLRFRGLLGGVGDRRK
jgi:hypothetical protein